MAKAYDIARLWAEQAPKGPRVAGNFWRDERRAGHYGTCIARLVEAPGGKLVALVLDSHWGTGTAMMINACDDYARKAGRPAFRVLSFDEEPDHNRNLAYFEKQARDCEAKIARARSRNWQADADRFRAQAQAYREAFGL